jgi:hypothetical protein
MKSNLEIVNNKQNINKLEHFVESFSDQVCLDSALSGVLLVVSDQIFEIACSANTNESLKFQINSQTDCLWCNWYFEMNSYNKVQRWMEDNTDSMLYRLANNWVWNNDDFLLGFEILNPSLSQQLSVNRRHQLMGYLGNNKKHARST